MGTNFSQFHSNFILRTPLLPLNLNFTEEALLDAFDMDIIKEAIYLASPVLHSEIKRLKNGEIKNLKDKQKIIFSFAKYYTRMCTRCTPYGLFASCSVGTFGDKTRINLSNHVNTKKCLKRHTRPDMNYLCALAQELVSNLYIREKLVFYPNKSIYKIGDQIRYIEFHYSNSARIHQIASVDDSEHLQMVLNSAGSGKNVHDLCILLINEEITYEEALGFINALIDSQLLVSELDANVTGPEFIDQLIKVLKRIESNSIDNGALSYLTNLKFALNQSDQKAVNEVEFYQDLFEKAKAFNVQVAENQLFQVDMFQVLENEILDSAVQNQLRDVLRFLSKLSSKKENSTLNKFKERFQEKYADDEVPLLIALDSESGIGYKAVDISGASSLIDDLNFNGRMKSEMNFAWTQQQEIIFNKYIEALRNKEQVIHFNEEDFKDIPQNSFQAPYSMSVMFRIVDKSGKLFIKNSGGSSAANLLGRFAHGNNRIEDIVRDICNFEKDQIPNKKMAEITHLPESRLGNVLQRPIFREYEIPYLAQSILKKENQILPENLMVSIKNGLVILKDKTIHTEIIPRLSNAHNYSQNALPVYHFLADLQTQYFDKVGFGFDWGVLSYAAKFLPRVEYKKNVISPATWRMFKQDFQSLLDSPFALLDLDNWRKKFNLPSLVIFAESDNELVINFDNKLSSAMFISCLKNKNQITLTEFFFNKDECFLEDEAKNGYSNEFITVVFSPNTNPEMEKPANGSGLSDIQRKFYPGEEWIYLKLYCGIKVADYILLNAIKPLMEEFKKRGLIDKWFFIRYSDPNWHLRLRLHVANIQDIGNITSEIYERINAFVKEGVIQKFQQDVYIRELERYGYGKIELAESYFWIDSETILSFLDMIQGEKGEKLRWQFSARCIDDLLSVFEYSFDKKLSILEKMKNGYIMEHGSTKELKVQLDMKYRKLRKDVEFILDSVNLELEDIEPLKFLIESRNQQLKLLFSEFKFEKVTDQVFVEDVLISYIHMTMNRIFFSRQRTHEMVIYDLLFRHYKSSKARIIKN